MLRSLAIEFNTLNPDDNGLQAAYTNAFNPDTEKQYAQFHCPSVPEKVICLRITFMKEIHENQRFYHISGFLWDVTSARAVNFYGEYDAVRRTGQAFVA